MVGHAMSKKKGEPFNNPFAALAKLKTPPTPARPARAPRASVPAAAARVPDDEQALFLSHVGEVRPVTRGGRGIAPPPGPPDAAALRITSDDDEALARLTELVADKGPLNLSDHDEHVEASAAGLDERILRKLRAGEYAPQAHVDLHGLLRDQAQVALDAFVHKARLEGLRCVLVVTGRGLHSKDGVPVLKESVQGWLSRGRLSRHVLAFTSAQPRDGGHGALYVLLRR